MSNTEIPHRASQKSSQYSRMILPYWHTAGVLFLIAGLIGLSTRLRQFGMAGHPYRRLFGYVLIMAAEWIITAFIWFGFRLRRLPFRSLLGEFSMGWRAVFRDLGLALAFLILANVVLGIFGHLIHATSTQSMRNILPHGNGEVVAFLLLSLTAAGCEEIIYRGYLQQQFTARTKSAAAGIIIQGIVFGVSHAYQGGGLVLTTALYGCFFGLLAHWRRSLRPGMIAHFLQDGIGGLLLAKFALK
jgi:uncharacterized protein